jgi:hypothetical protein
MRQKHGGRRGACARSPVRTCRWRRRGGWRRTSPAWLPVSCSAGFPAVGRAACRARVPGDSSGKARRMACGSRSARAASWSGPTGGHSCPGESPGTGPGRKSGGGLRWRSGAGRSRRSRPGAGGAGPGAAHPQHPLRQQPSSPVHPAITSPLGRADSTDKTRERADFIDKERT